MVVTIRAVTLAFLMIPPVGASAQTDGGSPDVMRIDLIKKYESAGGQNIPNFLFDGPYGRHSAGGVCQMLTSKWQRIAPTIDIDIVKFPVAGSAPEFVQWQACWKLWATEGYVPWTCCNAKLRQALAAHESTPAVRPAHNTKEASPKNPEPIRDKVAVYNDRLAASSAVDLSGLHPTHRDDSLPPTLSVFSSE